VTTSGIYKGIDILRWSVDWNFATRPQDKASRTSKSLLTDNLRFGVNFIRSVLQQVGRGHVSNQGYPVPGKRPRLRHVDCIEAPDIPIGFAHWLPVWLGLAAYMQDSGKSTAVGVNVV